MDLAWWFCGNKLRNGNPIPADGEWLRVEGNLVLCHWGLHASRQPYDALSNAPGSNLCLVEVEGIKQEESDKLVCHARRIIARMDATEMLFYYARMQALSVVNMWVPPDLVLDWLMTGDKSIKYAAESAARSAARSTARSAARSAAWSAASSAATSAATNEFT